MRKPILLLIFAAVLGLCAFTGCQSLGPTARDAMYDSERQQVGVVEKDSVMINETEYISVEEFVAQGGDVKELSPDKYVVAGTPIYETTYTLKPSVESGVSQLASFIPGGGLAAVLINGVLGTAAIWFRRKQLQERGEKETQRKVSQSLVQGIDTFRDVLDQTPQGEQIQTEMVRILRQHQDKLHVVDKVRELLAEYETPDKKAITLGA